MVEFKKIIRSEKGQSIIELGLALPIILLLSLGAIEISNMISSYLDLTHLTREGANLTSRGEGTDADITESLDAIIDAACPTISRGPTPPPISCPPSNAAQWTVIYSEIVPDVDFPDDPNFYKVNRPADKDWIRGSLGKSSKIGSHDGLVDWGEFGIDANTLTAGQSFNVIEVYYDYGPSSCAAPLNCPLTPLANLMSFFSSSSAVLPTEFYTRAIFTDVGS